MNHDVGVKVLYVRRATRRQAMDARRRALIPWLAAAARMALEAAGAAKGTMIENFMGPPRPGQTNDCCCAKLISSHFDIL